MRRPGLSRRRLLSATATGLVGALAGCGYRPGGGDLAWESSLGDGGLLGVEAPRFAVAPDRLFVVRNQSGRTFDFDTETWGSVENATVTAVDAAGATRLDAETERQAVAPPAVTGESVFVPVVGEGVTAIDRDAAGIDPDARETGGGTGGEATEAGDEIRWQVDGIGGDSGTGDSGESADPPGIEGVRASDRLVAVVTGTELAALDAETGDRAFGVTEAWTGPDDGSADRVAVEGENVWAAMGGENARTALVRFGPSGERRAERSVSAPLDWLVRADETLVAGSVEAGTVTGFDADLDRRFSLSVPTPSDRPPVVAGSDGRARRRLYLHRDGAARALDVEAGEIAWERTDAPARRRAAVDADGIYAVRSRAILAIGADGEDRWRAPLPDRVTVDELFAVGGRLIAVDGEELYGFHATPGERWSLVG
ncbi:PQQ-binding-like beta-propeller repeat protein [Halorubrum lipolyticum]|uniref:Pyrrolo-quinoline quinone n=1 Tax=Halorubrum lipolyticum DSM 21995 TaxID=1227482 RepID=M0NYR2_9EURY|nr:PQQ-binding-like beta-propeller repeat protein [Halorubrum lipolyticum]EMA63037.1 hypothetical protein C469_03415 [Halorubrum lipolyticum DSM 21995]